MKMSQILWACVLGFASVVHSSEDCTAAYKACEGACEEAYWQEDGSWQAFLLCTERCMVGFNDCAEGESSGVVDAVSEVAENLDDNILEKVLDGGRCKLDCLASLKDNELGCESEIGNWPSLKECLKEGYALSKQCLADCKNEDVAAEIQRRIDASTSSCPLCDMGCDAGGDYLKERCENKFGPINPLRGACKTAATVAVDKCNEGLCNSERMVSACEALAAFSL